MVTRTKPPLPPAAEKDEGKPAPEEETKETSPLGLSDPMPELPGGGEAIAMSMNGFAWPDELVGEALLHPLDQRSSHELRRPHRRPPRKKDVEIPQEYGNKYLLLFQKE
jgi:hypothetical protein